MILNEETFFQKTANNISFIEAIRNNGILPGVKLDKGLPLNDKNEIEKLNTGLEDLNTFTRY